MTAERRQSRSRAPDAGELIEPLLALSRARRSAPLIYLELIGLPGGRSAPSAAIAVTCRRAIAGVLARATGTTLRRRDVVAVGGGARWFAALLVARSLSGRTRDSGDDADLGLVAGRMRAAVQHELNSLERRHAVPRHVRVRAGWTVIEPVSPARVGAGLRQAIRGAAVVARLEERRASALAATSHELRTPLTSIVGFAEQLANGAAGDRDKRARYARIIAEEANRLHRLVGDLVESGVIGAARLRLNADRLSLARIARRVARLLAPAAAERSVKLSVGGDCTIHADGDRLTQVIANLTDNAIRHARRNGWVTISIEKRKHWARIEVKDDGEGFDDAARASFATPFAAGAFGHIGLGLVIAKRLVEAHGGMICAPTRSRGGVVRVDLPI